MEHEHGAASSLGGEKSAMARAPSVRAGLAIARAGACAPQIPSRRGIRLAIRHAFAPCLLCITLNRYSPSGRRRGEDSLITNEIGAREKTADAFHVIRISMAMSSKKIGFLAARFELQAGDMHDGNDNHHRR